MKICVVDGCSNNAGPGRGMCHKHYKRWQQHGHTGLTSGKGCTDPVERLAFRGRRMPSGCLEWNGTVGARGYGQTMWKYKFYTVHRLSWVLNFGEIPDGLCVCHHCDNPLCFEPTHLFLGTHQDNSRDRDRKGRGNPPKGERNASAKLTESDVRKIRSDPRRGCELADEYGLSRSTVSQIRHNLRWKHVV